MNLSMYSDHEKNILMFLPDNISDSEVMQLGTVLFPEDEDSMGPNTKPTGVFDLNNLHAYYPVDEIIPDILMK